MAPDMHDATVLPAGFRERVMLASRQIRPSGRAIPEVAADGPAEAFRRAVESLDALLGSLRPDEWRRHALRQLDVQQLVGHLTGVEEDVQRCLAGDEGVGRVSHIESTQPAADRQSGRTPEQTHAEWQRAAGRTLRLIEALDLSAIVALHGVQLPIGDILIARTFELWTHENDIRTALRRPPSVPPASTLLPMAGLAVRLLPFAALMSGLRGAASLRLVLTGAGGGTWDIAFGEVAPDPVPMSIVTDVVGFCRLVANRVSPGDLPVHVTGDAGLATSVLTAASALALD